jgi:Helitron helicase-like domain at N-terminus
MGRLRWRPPQWDFTCPRCDALLLHGERKSFCCNDGKWDVPSLPPLPENISAVLNDIDLSRNISTFSRRLNNLFAFTAIGATKGFTHFESGVSSVSITGRTYHWIFDVNDSRHSLHWYLYDENERVSEAGNRQVPNDWVDAVKTDLDRCNPYVHHLQQFHEIPDTVSTSLELSDFSSGGDFAAIMHAANSTTVTPRSILIRKNIDIAPTFIPIFNRHYEPLQYPVLFPHGSPGWGLKNDGDKQVKAVPYSQRVWYRTRLLTDDRFLFFGRLTSEYLCDMYSRIEEEKLSFIERSHHEDDDDADIDLPCSWTGSRKWASEHTADSLALASTYGPPSFFITMTCNPQWPEITCRLRHGQSASDIPVIVARVFKLRLERLIHLLKTRFGKVIYIIKVIEFQKRGLPHAHIIIKVCVFTIPPIFLT